MAQMKRLVLPILEEIGRAPGNRMEVYTALVRETYNPPWPTFKRIIGHLVDTGMVVVSPRKAGDRGGRLTLTPEGREAISYE